MSAKFDRIVKSLSDTIKRGSKKKTSAYDTVATIKRIEDGVAWVHIPGGVDETPVKLTINAVEGDSVQVRVGGGRAWITGNYDAPPTDDKMAVKAGAMASSAASVANEAVASAEVAHEAAKSAQSSAAQAQRSADEARVSATNANEYASRALTGLSTVQSVAETLTWITQHGTMTLTTDTAIDPSHVYFILDPNGDYVVGNTHYSLVTEPDPDDLASYYELSIDESLNNYVGTHLAVTEDGLWLLPAGQGTYKILVATGAGSTYTTAGTYIIDSTGGTIASFRVDGVTIGDILSGNTRIEITSGGMQVIRKVNNSDMLIANIGFGESTSTSGTSNAPYYTLGDRRVAVSDYSPSTTYYPGEVVRYNNKTWVYVNPVGSSGHTPSSSADYWKLYIGAYSFATGIDTVSSGAFSSAEGSGKALNTGAHAEGDSIALGKYSHAQNRGTLASGDYSTAQGVETQARHEGSSASGLGTRTSADNQTVVGQYNSDDSNALYIVGNGSSNSNRSNAFTVSNTGEVNCSTIEKTSATNVLVFRGQPTFDSSGANGITTTGIYLVGGTVPANYPSGLTWSPLIVLNISGIIVQIAIGASSIYIRRYSGSPASWSSWNTIS